VDIEITLGFDISKAQYMLFFKMSLIRVLDEGNLFWSSGIKMSEFRLDLERVESGGWFELEKLRWFLSSRSWR
jgi:hypothetical protein